MLYILQEGVAAASVVTETGQLPPGQGLFLQNLIGGLATAFTSTWRKDPEAARAMRALEDIFDLLRSVQKCTRERLKT